MATATRLKLHTMLGNYANTNPLKNGAIHSDLVDFDFVDVKVANSLFKEVVRDAKYDVAELAIVTYLQAKAYGTSASCTTANEPPACPMAASWIRIALVSRRAGRSWKLSSISASSRNSFRDACWSTSCSTTRPAR